VSQSSEFCHNITLCVASQQVFVVVVVVVVIVCLFTDSVQKLLNTLYEERL
jgi:hypothetical protein